jgi:hypothetical protein
MNDNLEVWEKWFIDHRSDEMAVLTLESLRILLARGEMTAEAVHHIPVKNPSIRGGLMKHLRRMGVVTKSALAEGTTKQSHGHTMFLWVATDTNRIRRLLDFGVSVFVPEKKKTETQMLLC